MKVTMGALTLGIEESMCIEEITFDTASDETYLHFKFRPEERSIRLDSALEDLPVGGI